MKGVLFMKRLAVFLWVISGLFLFGCEDSTKPHASFAAQVNELKTLKPFTVIDQQGKILTNQELMGKWNVFFLGYTHCPDICPMTLAKLHFVAQQLADSRPPLQIWFISVDPNRDTPPKRKQYIDYFNSSYIAASAPHEQLFPFARDLGLIYAIPDSNQPNYLVDHSASVALVNPKGQLYTVFKPEFKKGSVPTINAKQLAQEIAAIIKGDSE